MGNCSKYLLDILPEDGHAICVQINIYDDDSIFTQYLLEFTQNSYSCRMFIGVWVEKKDIQTPHCGQTYFNGPIFNTLKFCAYLYRLSAAEFFSGFNFLKIL